MSERPISNMPTEEFDAIIDAYIERETKDTGEIEAPLFYEALREMVEADATAEEIEVEGTIVNRQLVLNVPLDIDDELALDDIELLLGGRRFAVKVKDGPLSPTAP